MVSLFNKVMEHLKAIQGQQCSEGVLSVESVSIASAERPFRGPLEGPSPSLSLSFHSLMCIK